MRRAPIRAILVTVIGCALAGAMPAPAGAIALEDSFYPGTYVIAAKPPQPGIPRLYVGTGSLSPRDHRVWLLPGGTPANRRLVEWKVRQLGYGFTIEGGIDRWHYYFIPAHRPGAQQCLASTAALNTDLVTCPRLRSREAPYWWLDKTPMNRIAFGREWYLNPPGATPQQEPRLCLDIRGPSYVPRAVVQVRTCRAGAWHQRFTIYRVFPGCSVRGGSCLRRVD